MTKRVTKSSGNVFADIGVRNPDEALVKARLARVIARAIEARQMTQSEAADLLGIDQLRVSSLVRGKLAGFSIDRLFRFLMALGCDIEIVVKDSARPSWRSHMGKHVGSTLDNFLDEEGLLAEAEAVAVKRVIARKSW